METLGEDILLLAIRPNGKIGASGQMRFALSGSELVRLAAARRVEVVRDRVVLLNPAPTGDALTDAALRSIGGTRRPPRPKDWVVQSQWDLMQSYLERLAAADVIAAVEHMVWGIFPVIRWTVLDTARATEAKARLDVIAHSSGPVDVAQAAFAGLVHAIGLDAVLYPGWDGREARRRLDEIARHTRTADAVRAAADRARGTEPDTPDTSVDGAVHAATGSAIHASVQAATDAAVIASIDAAHHAAAHHGGDHDGASAGHH